VTGKLDADGCLQEVDRAAADDLVLAAIAKLGDRAA
jgi:hypothetical protein